MKNRNLKLFYLHELLFQFSDTMLVLVLPIFIYKLFGSISAVFIMIMIWNLIHGILFIPVFNLAMKCKKPKYFMMIGIVFYISALSLFSMITPESKVLIIPAVLAFSLYVSFYWMVRHWFIATNADYKMIGKQMSVMIIIRTLISFAAPIVGGAVSFIISFNVTFIIGVIAGAASLIPIILFNAPPLTEKYTFKKVRHALTRKEVKAVSPGYFWEGVSSVSINHVWILIFAIFIGNILDLGLLVGFTTLVTGLTIWFTGTWFDKKSRPKLLTNVIKVRTLIVMGYASVFFLPHIAYIWVVEFMNKLMFTTQCTILDSYLYGYGNKINPVDFMLAREVYLNISRFITAGILATTFYFLPESYLWPAVFLASFTVLGMSYAKRSDQYLNS